MGGLIGMGMGMRMGMGCLLDRWIFGWVGR